MASEGLEEVVIKLYSVFPETFLVSVFRNGMEAKPGIDYTASAPTLTPTGFVIPEEFEAAR